MDDGTGTDRTAAAVPDGIATGATGATGGGGAACRDPGGQLVVYWRPGCWFCTRLLRALDRSGVRFELRDIWQDDEARMFVREHNGGDETVPTVALGGEVATNPDPDRYIAHLATIRPDLVGGSEHVASVADGD